MPTWSPQATTDSAPCGVSSGSTASTTPSADVRPVATAAPPDTTRASHPARGSPLWRSAAKSSIWPGDALATTPTSDTTATV